VKKSDQKGNSDSNSGSSGSTGKQSKDKEKVKRIAPECLIAPDSYECYFSTTPQTTGSSGSQSAESESKSPPPVVLQKRMIFMSPIYASSPSAGRCDSNESACSTFFRAPGDKPSGSSIDDNNEKKGEPIGFVATAVTMTVSPSEKSESDDSSGSEGSNGSIGSPEKQSAVVDVKTDTVAVMRVPKDARKGDAEKKDQEKPQAKKSKTRAFLSVIGRSIGSLSCLFRKCRRHPH
jgi:hypothetical protein